MKTLRTEREVMHALINGHTLYYGNHQKVWLHERGFIAYENTGRFKAPRAEITAFSVNAGMWRVPIQE